MEPDQGGTGEPLSFRQIEAPFIGQPELAAFVESRTGLPLRHIGIAWVGPGSRGTIRHALGQRLNGISRTPAVCPVGRRRIAQNAYGEPSKARSGQARTILPGSRLSTGWSTSGKLRARIITTTQPDDYGAASRWVGELTACPKPAGLRPPCQPVVRPPSRGATGCVQSWR